MGDVPAAIDRYTDIPEDVRAKLKARMLRRDYDDMVTIRRDSIEGNRPYEPGIRDMYFGSGRICHAVSRSRWAPDLQERGLVYCESGQCILVPTVCRNVSRITALPAAAPPVAAAPPAGDELVFAPPGAGPPADAVGPDVLPASTPPPEGGSIIGPPIPVATFPIIPGGLIPPSVPPVTPAVPEPQTWALWLAGLTAMAWRRLRRRGRADARLSSTTAAGNAP